MTPYRLHRISWMAACAIVGVLSSATPAHGQTNFDGTADGGALFRRQGQP